MNRINARRRVLLLASALLLGGCRDLPMTTDAPAIDRELSIVPSAWSTALSPTPGSSVANNGLTGNAQMHYNRPSPSYGSPGTWRFTTTSPVVGTVTLGYSYFGFHSFFMAEARIRAYIRRAGGDLYPSGYLFSGSVSGGFSLSGSATFNVQAGDEYGFEVYGFHYDGTDAMSGDLTIVNASIAPIPVNLVQDGSFETPLAPHSPGWTTFNAGSSFPGWSVSGTDGVDVHWGEANVHWTNIPDGQQALDLNGSSTGAVLSQQINGVIAGEKYRISFYVSSNPACDPATVSARVKFGGNDLGVVSFVTNNHPISNMVWEQRVLDVIASANNAALSFQTQTNGGCGMVIDAVDVRIVPTVPNHSPSATLNNANGNEGAAVTFSATVGDADNDALTVVWSFGDGSAAETVNYPAGTTSISRSHIYANNRNFNTTSQEYEAFPASIQVTDGKGGSATANANAVITNVNPNLTFSPASQTIAAGTSANFTFSYTDPGTEPGGWEFAGDWGDGSQIPNTPAPAPGVTSNLAHQFLLPGTYVVHLKVREVNEVVGGTVKNVTVIVANTPPVVNQCGPFRGFEGHAIQVSCAGTDPNGDQLTYSWDFGNGSVDGGSASITYPDNGHYTATFTANDGQGGTSSVEIGIDVDNVAPIVTAPATLSVQSMTALNFSGSFTDPGADAPWSTKVEWGESTPTDGTSAVAGLVSAIHTYNAPGNYTIKLSVADEEATGSAITQLTVINRLPTARISAMPSTFECAGALTPVSLNGSTSSDPEGFALTYEWLENGVSFANTANAVRQCAMGTHTVTLNVKDAHGGEASATATFTIVDTSKPLVSFSVSNPTLLWSPNHKYVLINTAQTMSDVCTPASGLVVTGYVVSSEPDEAKGDGNFTGDVRVTRGNQVFVSSNANPQVPFNPFTDKLELRAERSGNNVSRYYTIVLRVRDAAGIETEVRQVVTVPHDQR